MKHHVCRQYLMIACPVFVVFYLRLPQISNRAITPQNWPRHNWPTHNWLAKTGPTQNWPNPKTGPTPKLAESQYWPNPNTGPIPKLVQFQIWFKPKSSFYEDKNLYIFQMWTLSDRLSPNRSNPGHCLSQAQARALLGLYFLLYKILNFLGPSRKVKLELGLIQPGPFSKFRARALKKWILI